jgi:nucleoside-diphosphate-sugar epimerase
MPDPGLASTALIVGCGYVGRRLAQRLVERGVTVYATTRSHDNAPALAELGVRPLIVSVTQRVTLAALRPAAEADQLDLFYLVPPGRPHGSPSPRQVLIQGADHVLRAVHSPRLHRAVFTSSTVVYEHDNDQRVDADTPTHPSDERGAMLLDAERHWLNHGSSFHVVRLAGLYGPHRVIGLTALREHAPLVGNPQARLNLIHGDDAADLLMAIASAPHPGRVELGCDDHPPTRLEYYQHLARCIGEPPPEVLDDESAVQKLGLSLDRLRRSCSKICDSTPTRRRTGWSPRFADYRQGLADSLQQMAG